MARQQSPEAAQWEADEQPQEGDDFYRLGPWSPCPPVHNDTAIPQQPGPDKEA